MDEIRNMILRYLAKRPDAQDTLEGVAYWWIQQERIEWSLELIESALDSLVADRLLVKKMDRIYALNKHRHKDIHALLERKV